MEATTTTTQSQTKSWLSEHWLLVTIVAVVSAIIVFFYLRAPAQTTAVLASTLRQSIPLILGGLCGLVGERTGVINIGIEGQMLMAAFVGFLVNVYTGNLLLAVLGGVLAGVLMGALLAFMSVTLRMDQIIAGTVINILAVGLTGYFYVTGLTTQGKIQPIPLGPLADIPLVGPVLFNNPPITYLTIILVFVLQYALFNTRWGLRTRAVGEHPSAADTVGINVFRTRYRNVIIGGALAGLAGAFLSLEAVGSFERGMTNGRGFVALAVMIFGNWTPIGTLGAALLFGFTLALQTQLQFMGILSVPHQFIGMIPYVTTIVVLAFFGSRTRPPAAVGQPYQPGG